MVLPSQLLLSDLLGRTVRCELGLDHGPGLMAWMHPPVHRLLGWVSRPSVLHMSRDVWRLDQCRGITDQQVFVRGKPAVSDQNILDRLPTLIGGDLINRDGKRIGLLVDLAYESSTGTILHYLVSRSDPRLPGHSLWRLLPDRITEQHSGYVMIGSRTLDDLPLVRSSIRQSLLQRTQRWRDQLQEIGSRASDRLEGWMEESLWNESRSKQPFELNKLSKEASVEEIWDSDIWSESPSQRRS
ncbi:RNA methyltransferase [Synechococcus sp. M16CYN]|uniref:RNA methyltransferase n=1 Tax=Synechococcus sp. M16CYN TaxID=3103139 RepID=UPI00325459DA